MRTSIRTSRDHRNLSRHLALPAALIVLGAAGVTACSSTARAAGSRVSPVGVAAAVWGAATDGGYRCLRETGGASGQCDLAMGIAAGGSRVSPVSFSAPVWGPATDGGYRCLRETGGASGQCDLAMGIS